MKTGTVKWFNNTKGFGFITPDESGQDLFVHYSDVQMEGYRNLVEGQQVTFTFADGPKGPAASQVMVQGVIVESVAAPVEALEEALASAPSTVNFSEKQRCFNLKRLFFSSTLAQNTNIQK